MLGSILQLQSQEPSLQNGKFGAETSNVEYLGAKHPTKVFRPGTYQLENLDGKLLNHP